MFFAVAPLIDPSTWIRVEDPEYPGALAHSATGAILAAPPTDGTPWREETVPELTETIPLNGEGGDPAALTNADLWQADGVTGAGVKVAVFDLAWFQGDTDPDAIGDVTTHDCFVSPTCEVPFDPIRPHSSSEGGHHGWACAEAVHEIAPDADLHAIRVDSFTMYENAVDWAVREGVDIVSMSMSFYNDSFYDGTGPHDALMKELEAAGVLMVVSSGNDADVHWQGDYVDSDGDGRMDGDADNAVSLYLDKSTTVTLLWNQWNGRCGDTDLDLRITDLDGNIVGSSATRQDRPVADDGKECKSVDIAHPTVEEPGYYRVEVLLHRGVRTSLFVQLFSKAGSFEHAVAEGSVTDPGDHPLAIAVGAVKSTNYWDGPPEPYSSRGPTLTGVPKPEIMGPDGLSGAGFGPVAFFGTSASTPVVAGLVAEVMADDPSLNARQAFDRLRGWTHLPSQRPGDPWGMYGAGLARLPVRDPARPGCGNRPLWLVCLIGPLGGLRRRPWRVPPPARILSLCAESLPGSTAAARSAAAVPVARGLQIIRPAQEKHP